MRAEGDFEPAAERRAVNRGDDGDGSVFHGRLDFVQARRLRHVAAELADVGAGDERPAVADHHDRLRTVFDGLGHAVEQALAHVPAEGVDRRVVDDDERNTVVHFETDGLGEFGHVDSQPNPTV